MAEHHTLEVEADDVAELVTRLDERFNGLAGYLVDERRALRKHVNVFVNGKPISDRRGLSDPLDAEASVQIMQALSGG